MVTSHSYFVTIWEAQFRVIELYPLNRIRLKLPIKLELITSNKESDDTVLLPEVPLLT